MSAEVACPCGNDIRCSHGEFACSCGLCERDTLIADLVEVLKTTAGNIRSLGPAGAIGREYEVWLRVVEEAIGKGSLSLNTREAHQ